MSFTHRRLGKGSQTQKILYCMVPLHKVQEMQKLTYAVEVRIVVTFVERGGNGQTVEESVERASERCW